MIPSVTQQLEAIKRTLVASVAPELPAEAAFARQQVLLIGAALDFLIECHAHEYRYAVVENVEYRTLLNELAGRAAVPRIDATDTLAEEGPAPGDAQLQLRTITEQTRRMKVLCEQLYADVAADAGGDLPAVLDLQARTAERQVEREASWYRLAGFTMDAPPIEALLGGSTSGPP
ncbi:MAG: hypothetical protein QOI16_478 [Pseudonocardiales bacterium]|nr:hypothetical protein [Pseudonocardiales bacterium]